MTKSKIIKPIPCANNLVKIWRQYGGGSYPIDVELLITGFINQQYKNEAITILPVSSNFDGALAKNEDGKWGLFYNQNIRNIGRKNFTIAHELGHYLCHRSFQEDFKCGNKEIYQSKENIETEANRFASYLLMPIDDFRQEVSGQKIDFNLFKHCADKYQTSLKAVILKWLEFTPLHAVLIISVDEMVLWSRSSNPAFKNGIYFKSITDLPEKSFAKQKQDYGSIKNPLVTKGVWHQKYPATEFSFYSETYDETFTLLIFKGVSNNNFDDKEEELEDSFDYFEMPTSNRN
ncbi:MAG: hypothetical protein ACJAZX_001596 [Rickettsiales bacterium]|jgi:hypothetical protein